MPGPARVEETLDIQGGRFRTNLHVQNQRRTNARRIERDVNPVAFFGQREDRVQECRPAGRQRFTVGNGQPLPSFIFRN